MNKSNIGAVAADFGRLFLGLLIIVPYIYVVAYHGQWILTAIKVVVAAFASVLGLILAYLLGDTIMLELRRRRYRK